MKERKRKGKKGRALVVVNKKSGNYSKRVDDRADVAVGKDLVKKTVDVDDDYPSMLATGKYDLLVVCGGDGTLHSVLNKTQNVRVKTVFLPCGTFNEKARTLLGNEGHSLLVGKLGETVFTYVAACGSFTPIGYDTSVEKKKRYKVLAYLTHVVREYRIHRIRATVTLDGKKEEGEYTLIMFVKSDRCFGFRFNRMFDPNKKTGHALLIKAPEKGGLVGLIKMFFPFFRAFFLGFGREYRSKNMLFTEFSEGELLLEEERDFAVDGERKTFAGKNVVTVSAWQSDFRVLE